MRRFFVILIVLILMILAFFNVSQHEEQLQPIKELPLKHKIGQMLIAGLPSKTIDDHAKRLIDEWHVSGFNLLKRNISDESQAKKLISDLKDYNNRMYDEELLIAVDQEGGDVVRFKFLKELTSQTQIKTVDQAFNVAFSRGNELEALGVNMNFAPVVDVVTDKTAYLYSRTFATTAEATALLGKAMVDGYLQADIIPVLKHYPGYGNISDDPHKKKTADSYNFEKFILPFRAILLDTNIPVMTAHIKTDADTVPATFSKKILHDTLREQWNYEGVVMTDDIEMASVGMKPEEAALKAIDAGADIIISTYTPEVHIKILEEIEKAVVDGRLNAKRIDQSLARIKAMKNR